MNRRIKYFAIICASFFLSSCFEANTDELEKAISKVQDNQKIILKKLRILKKVRLD